MTQQPQAVKRHPEAATALRKIHPTPGVTAVTTRLNWIANLQHVPSVQKIFEALDTL